MPLPIIGELLATGLRIIDKVIPDPAAKLAAQTELLKLQQNGELAYLAAETDLAKGQIAINATEAANASLFISGWRPALGWLIISILGTNYLIVPLLAWLAPLTGLAAPGRLDIGELYPVLLGMLGLGGMRTYEKKNGVA